MIKFKEKFKIIEDGDMSPLDDVLDKLEPKIKEGEDYTLYLLDHKKNRTLNANRYYHGVVLKVLCEEIGIKNPDITAAHLHEVMKAKFNAKMVLIDGIPYEIGESTTKINKDRFKDYIESIREWALETFNCWIPLPEEVIESDFGDLYIEAYHDHK
tara:strand:- start:1191 stop:1658 length:468 start_codon:yes stop_codon:yes gene_type:complete